MTLINRASKGQLMDVLEQFCIQKYSPEHTLIEGQITGENFMTHSYVTLLLELVLASALMLQSCACRVTHHTLLTKLVRIKNIRRTFNILGFFYFIMIIAISLLVSMFYLNSGIYI
jgi:hypothetical protein